jgi:hypothetical protein
MVKRASGTVMVVQFARSLSAGDITELRDEYGLALDRYVPTWAYIERVGDDALERLRRDPRVRSCTPQDPAMKLDDATRAGRVSDNVPGPPGSGVAAAAFRATLVDDAEPDEVARALTGLGARDVRVLDDRPLGGRARIRFALDDPEKIPEVAAVEDIVAIEPVSRQKGDGPATAAPGGPAADILALWDRGLHGEGQVIGMIDNGPPDIDHCFFADTAPNSPGPAHRKIVVVRNAASTAPGRHPTFVAGCAVGDDRSLPGAGPSRGGAWAARLACGNRNDVGESSTLLAELNAAKAAGAFIHTNSWHFETDGAGRPARYTQDSVDVDDFTFRNEDHLVLGSAGNQGEEQGPPGTAKNAVCVSAASIDPEGPRFGDGNAGPTADGQRKPDFVAAGCDIESALGGTPCGSGRFTVLARCATSFATPRAAAAAALVRQYFVDGWHPGGAPRAADTRVPSGALLKAVLLNSTAVLADVPERPSDRVGWGYVQAERTLAFAGLPRRLAVWDVRHADGMAGGDIRKERLDVPPSATGLRVTLVWIDPPPSALPAERIAVNHLRLSVVAPDGAVHPANDDIDPVRMVDVSAPAAGNWTIIVEAVEVNLGRPGQGYALVAAIDAV